LPEEGELDYEAIGSSRVFHFGSVSMTHEPAATATLKAAEYAKTKGLLISFDPNLRESLWDDLKRSKGKIRECLTYADVVKLSEEELAFLTGTNDLVAGSLQVCREYGSKLLLVTLGHKGCIYRFGQAVGHIPGFQVQPVAGAGDAFLAGILYGLLKKETLLDGLTEHELRQLIRFANTAAALFRPCRGCRRCSGCSKVPKSASIWSYIGLRFISALRQAG
jgi:fructokinase